MLFRRALRDNTKRVVNDLAVGLCGGAFSLGAGRDCRAGKANTKES